MNNEKLNAIIPSLLQHMCVSHFTKNRVWQGPTWLGTESARDRVCKGPTWLWTPRCVQYRPTLAGVSDTRRHRPKVRLLNGLCNRVCLQDGGSGWLSAPNFNLKTHYLIIQFIRPSKVTSMKQQFRPLTNGNVYVKDFVEIRVLFIIAHNKAPWPQPINDRRLDHVRSAGVADKSHVGHVIMARVRRHPPLLNTPR